MLVSEKCRTQENGLIVTDVVLFFFLSFLFLNSSDAIK